MKLQFTSNFFYILGLESLVITCTKVLLVTGVCVAVNKLAVQTKWLTLLWWTL